LKKVWQFKHLRVPERGIGSFPPATIVVEVKEKVQKEKEEEDRRKANQRRDFLNN